MVKSIKNRILTKVLKKLFYKKYLLYGSSIIFTRGFEYLVLFYAANHFDKTAYGNLEFYKKIIELGASFLAFGFPALILSYTTNRQNKDYFFVLSTLFSTVFAIIIFPVLYFLNMTILLIPLLFYAVFFSGGIVQNYLLVRYNSNLVSAYKIVTAVIFYSLVFLAIYELAYDKYAFVFPAYFLFPVFSGIFLFYLYRLKLSKTKLTRYYGLFKHLLGSSMTLVVNNFAGLMFLYTDILIIKILSNQAEIDIANYSFSLNVANALMLIPLTLVQVDVEKLKKSTTEIKILFKKIIILISLASLFLIVGYWGLINRFFIKYQDTFYLFLIILGAKYFQALSPLYGTFIAIKRKFRTNLNINLFALVFNIVFSYILYHFYGLYGIALSSLISLLIRYWLFRFYTYKLIES